MTKIILISLLVSFLLFPISGSTQEKSSPKIKIGLNNWFDKSSIKPNEHIFSILASNNQYPLILLGPSVFLQQNFTRPFAFTKRYMIDAAYLNYEYTLKHNFFVEGGFKYLKYVTGFKSNFWIINKAGPYYYSESLYSTLSFDFGSGYRIIVNDNIRLFDFHAGISIGITNNKIGTGRISYLNNTYIDAMNNIGILEYYSEGIITNRFNLGYYIGISKDIRVTNNLYFTARYNNHFGENSIVSKHIINYSLSTLGIVNSVPAKLTAKGKMYAIGLRWIFRN